VYRSKHELETAYEELQSTNEELETTNEELQSTVEELETTNEELQSTNEELETMNEELQSTNEELQTVNIELRERSEELLQANLFQESILGSLRHGVAVLDEQLNVLVWNHEAEDLWGLRAAEAKGQAFVGLDIGLPVDRLGTPIRRVMAGQTGRETVHVEAVNRRGKAIKTHVTCSPLRLQGGAVRGVIVLMEDGDRSDAV
jgi:two-component system CheB/CheR fusion protein